MTHNKIKSLFVSAVQSVTSSISDYAVNPDKDFTRDRKLSPDKLISFLVSEGSSTTKNELLDFFGFDLCSPSASAFSQQRAKLKPESLYAVFNNFNQSVAPAGKHKSNYRFLAAYGSTATFFSRPEFSDPDYYVKSGNSAKGVYSIHIADSLIRQHLSIL